MVKPKGEDAQVGTPGYLSRVGLEMLKFPTWTEGGSKTKGKKQLPQTEPCIRQSVSQSVSAHTLCEPDTRDRTFPS